VKVLLRLISDAVLDDAACGIQYSLVKHNLEEKDAVGFPFLS
jgi:hypothetical protein